MKKIRKIKILLIENKDFVRISLSGFISNFGSQFTVIALLSLSYKITSQKSALAYTTFFYLFPILIGSFFSGVLSDSYNRRKIMIITDLLRSIIVLGFILAVNFQNIIIVYIVSFILSTTSQFFKNAKSAILPEITNRQKIVEYNSIISGIDKFVYLFAMALGGFALSFTSYKTIFIFDSITYIISAILILDMKYSTHLPIDRKEKFHKLFKEGFIYIYKNGLLRSIVFFYALQGLANGVMNILITILVFDSFKNEIIFIPIITLLIAFIYLVGTLSKLKKIKLCEQLL